MNISLRFQNKTTLVAIITTVIAFIYQCLGIFEVVPPISEEQTIQAIGVFVNLLVLLGVVVDPTTPGIEDSQIALNREHISESEDDDELISRAKHAKQDQ